MIRKLLSACLLAPLAGCISFHAPTDSTGAVPLVTPAGIKNGWGQPDAFNLPASADAQTTSVPEVSCPQSITMPARTESDPETQPGEQMASFAVRELPGRSVAEASETGVSPSEPLSSSPVPVRRLVNSKSIVLDYELTNVGPSGVSAVEVWCTRDGRNWAKSGTITEGKSPIRAETPEEGFYGFTLVARNGVGLSKRPPRAGEPPQIAVEVDLTRPVVRLIGAKVAGDAAERRLIITWRATDKNLGHQPITLAYAERPEGPWQPFAEGQDNTGRYVWELPAAAPLRFLLRVTATDLAGNVGVAQTPTPILMDENQPEVSIRTVEPVGNAHRR